MKTALYPWSKVQVARILECVNCATERRVFVGVVATDDLEKAFKDIDAAFMVGSMPRKQGMERKDLLSCNVSIFKSQVSAVMSINHFSLLVLTHDVSRL